MKTHRLLSAVLLTVLTAGFFPHYSYAATACASCKSIAEGADRSAAAKAESWTGTIIGVNFGDSSVIVTDGVKLDHIKAYAQRYVKISPETMIVRGDEELTFDDLDVGQKITSYGSYNPNTRVVDATTVAVVATVASAPSAVTLSDIEALNGGVTESVVIDEKDNVAVAITTAVPEPDPTPVPVTTSAQPAIKKFVFTKNLQMGNKGADVIELQRILTNKGFLKMPKGVAYGTYGSMTRDAVKAYQKSMKIKQTGTIGPQTRAALNK